jgi:CubicO group peptidase (beta-lactamase class C family)
MVRALERARPAHPPGAWNAYHGITFGWLVGELIQRVTRRRFAEVIESELAKPLGLDGLFIGAPPEAKRRAAELSRPRVSASPERLRPFGRVVQRVSRALRLPFDPAVMADALIPRQGADAFWHPRVLDVPIPAVNGLFTARSLARLYAALAARGSLDGARLLSPETLRRATEVQSRRLDRVVPVRMHWRLGYHRAFTSRGDLRTGFGHFGFGGSGAWADPERELAVAMVNNRVAGGPFGDLRMVAIGGAAVGAAARRGR